MDTDTLPEDSTLSSASTFTPESAQWLIQHLPLGVVVQDHQGRVLDANPAAQNLLGLSLADLQNTAAWGLMSTSGDEPFGLNERLNLSAEPGPLLKLAGEPGRRLKLTVIVQPGDHLPLVHLVFEDVTASQAVQSSPVQAELQRSEKRYRALVQATSQYVWTNTPEGCMEGEQPDWAALTGQTQAEYQGHGWASAVHPDDRAETLTRWEVAVASRSRFETEHRVCVAGDEYHTFSVRAVPLIGPEGEVQEWVGLHTDITPLRQAEAALKGANSELAALAEERSRAYAELSRFNDLLLGSAGEGIFGLYPDGRARFANPAAAQLLGYTVQELEGQPMHALIHSRRADGSPYPEEECPVSQALKRPELPARRIEGEVFWRKDGTAIPVEYVVTPLPEEGGSSGGGIGGGVVLLFQDVTAQQQARAALKQAITELERSNRELEQFAYVSSHDLQEPLRTVGSYAELLGRRYKGQLDPRADQYLDFMQDAVTRMRQLINDLLSFSRIGRNEVPVQPVPLEGVMKDLAASLSLKLAETGADLSWQTLPTVKGNAVQLGQLLGNLISNALKFRSPDLPPIIRVEGRVEGRVAHIRVSDNGIGIAPEFQERVFGLFQRLHRREEYEGTGLGLAICRKIAQSLGGEVRLESQPGVGTTIIVTLPLA
jgi:PAS domain S-box-containing protein